jgi:hypothetical protein
MVLIDHFNMKFIGRNMKLVRAPVGSDFSSYFILSREGVAVNGVWIGYCIYWPLIHMTRNLKQLQRHC